MNALPKQNAAIASVHCRYRSTQPECGLTLAIELGSLTPKIRPTHDRNSCLAFSFCETLAKRNAIVMHLQHFSFDIRPNIIAIGV